eukprot:6175322-Pleurochrysis_carterae.AAC.1
MHARRPAHAHARTCAHAHAHPQQQSARGLAATLERPIGLARECADPPAAICARLFFPQARHIPREQGAAGRGAAPPEDQRGMEHDCARVQGGRGRHARSRGARDRWRGARGCCRGRLHRDWAHPEHELHRARPPRRSTASSRRATSPTGHTGRPSPPPAPDRRRGRHAAARAAARASALAIACPSGAANAAALAETGAAATHAADARARASALLAVREA